MALSLQFRDVFFVGISLALVFGMLHHIVMKPLSQGNQQGQEVFYLLAVFVIETAQLDGRDLARSLSSSLMAFSPSIGTSDSSIGTPRLFAVVAEHETDRQTASDLGGILALSPLDSVLDLLFWESREAHDLLISWPGADGHRAANCEDETADDRFATGW